MVEVVGLVLLWAAFVYIWIMPLFRPRGDYLWGYYRLRDIYIGIPIGLAALCATAIMASPARYRRHIALRLTTLCIFIVITFFASDVVYSMGLRGAWQSNFWSDHVGIGWRDNTPDDELGWVRKPGISWTGRLNYIEDNRSIYYRTDENGFRNAPGVNRADIVFIGDSYTEAAEVAEGDAFVQRVAAATGQRVVNLGRGGYSAQQQLIVLRRYGLSYKPRVVVWQLFEGNDLYDADKFASWKENRYSSTPLMNRFLKNSIINYLLRGTIRPNGTGLARMHYSDGRVLRFNPSQKYRPDQPAQLKPALAEVERAIEAGHRLCESQGIHLVVIHVPLMLRVLEPYITFDRAVDRENHFPGGIVQGKEDFTNKMAELCERLGIPYIDTFSALRSRASVDNRRVYLMYDEHLDVEGHEVVAQEVSGWLRPQQAAGARK